MNKGDETAGPMRTVVHPGAVCARRVQMVPVMTTTPERHLVAAGADLFGTIHDLVMAQHIAGGAFRLIAGRLRHLTLMTGGAGQGDRPMDFKGPHTIPVAVAVVTGAGCAGHDEAGAPFSHCHAVFRDAAGTLIGGHLLPGEAIADDEGVAIELVPLLDARFVRRHDAETGFTIFHPELA